MESYTRKSFFEKLHGHCSFAGPDDYVEITEWANGEGFDVDISSKLSNRFQLTWGEWEAIRKIVEHLEGDVSPVLPTEIKNPKFRKRT
jgi:hypothetical protein